MKTGRSPLYKPALLLGAVVCLLGAGFFQRQLNTLRADPHLGLTRAEPLENAPPVLAFTTVALGGFRGLIANALWIRANDLQLEGKYFEMVQLADWITKLQPYIPQVWIVQAWNMAYNISIKFTDPQDRWRWVQRGIELLRDEGLRYNPKEALLYRELAYFYQHKIGQNLDDAHRYYKQQLAKEMDALFGGGRPNFEELLHPQTPEAQERVRVLRGKYKMDPADMKEVDERYGPFDWRLPEAHAIYWAYEGLKNANENLINLRRVLYQCMHMLVLRGRILSVDPLRFAPNFDFVDKANKAYEEMIAETSEKKHVIETAHRNFLREVVYLLYAYNRLADAQRYFDYTRRRYPNAIPENVSLEQYALQRLIENIPYMTHDRTKALLDGMLVQHFFNLAIDEDDRAEALDRMARQLWVYYNDRVAVRGDALRMPPYPEMKRAVLDDVLDPERGFEPALAARLRTKLGLPPPSASQGASSPPSSPPAGSGAGASTNRTANPSAASSAAKP